MEINGKECLFDNLASQHSETGSA